MKSTVQFWAVVRAGVTSTGAKVLQYFGHDGSFKTDPAHTEIMSESDAKMVVDARSIPGWEFAAVPCTVIFDIPDSMKAAGTERKMKVTAELVEAALHIAKRDISDGITRAELGVRVQPLCKPYINRLTQHDKKLGDLHETLADAVGVEFDTVDGRAVLDFYMYAPDGLCTNLLLEVDADGPVAAFEHGHSLSHLRWVREGGKSILQ